MTTTTADGERIARLLERQRAGEAGARDELFTLLYGDLRRLAARELRNERAGHTAGPTSLVHDLYVRLADLPVTARDKRELLGLAAVAMRRALVDSARSRRRRREGLERERGASSGKRTESTPPEVERLERSLARLDELDEELAEVVRLRFLAGLPVEEVARVLEVSAPTVKRRWRTARAWLRRDMEKER